MTNFNAYFHCTALFEKGGSAKRLITGKSHVPGCDGFQRLMNGSVATSPQFKSGHC
jgi:hypothetical protein